MYTIFLFPGHKCKGDVNNWSLYFLNRLKSIGEVILVNYPWYEKAASNENVTHKLNINTFCTEIYNSTNSNKIILIGHSMGSQFVYWLNVKFDKRVVLSILIDGSLWGPFWWKGKDYSNVELTDDPIKNIFIQISSYKKYQTINIKSPVISLWDYGGNPDRDQIRIKSEEYWEKTLDNYHSVKFENTKHYMHLNKHVADFICDRLKFE